MSESNLWDWRIYSKRSMLKEVLENINRGESKVHHVILITSITSNHVLYLFLINCGLKNELFRVPGACPGPISNSDICNILKCQREECLHIPGRSQQI